MRQGHRGVIYGLEFGSHHTMEGRTTEGVGGGGQIKSGHGKQLNNNLQLRLMFKRGRGSPLRTVAHASTQRRLTVHAECERGSRG
jgi:hypothetical protein